MNIRRILRALSAGSTASAENRLHRHVTHAPESLEPRLLMAAARNAGGSGYSGTLSTNPALQQQQLICDPVEPKSGSSSVQYDPAMVRLVGVQPGPGYANSYFNVYVEVKPAYLNCTILQPLASFLSCPAGRETGYAQIKYRLSGTAGQLQPPSGYTTVDDGGVDGVDTHAVMFKMCGGTPANAVARYQIFAARAGTHGGNQEDFLVTNDGTNTRLGPDQLSPAFVSTNAAPVITSAGGPYVINEGSPLQLHATATDRETAASALAYSWDLNNDGQADATGSDPIVPAGVLATLGLGDGLKVTSIRLTVSDGDKSASAVAPLAVNNVAPTAAVNAPTDASLGAAAAFTLSASDPSTADRAAGFQYLVDWGDGTPLQTVSASANNGTGLNVNHAFARIGVRTVTVRAVDKDGGVSAPVSKPVVVRGAQLLPDPSKPLLSALFISGSTGADVIRTANVYGGLQVFINSVNAGVFNCFTRVIAYGQGGNDDIIVKSAPAVVFGGAGDDKITAVDCPAILVGGAGADTLVSGRASDLLIGGDGPDSLCADGGDDILIAGSTKFDGGSDDDVRALSSILAEWSRDCAYDTRISHLTGASGGLNGSIFLRPGVTVFDDGAVDNLLGADGRDWFILRNTQPGVLDRSDVTYRESALGV